MERPAHSEKKIVGIIGRGITHSLSPAMHTAAFTRLRLPFTFGMFDVTEEFLPALIQSLRGKNVVGVNVTIPHKERVMPLLDEVTKDAETLGAVNVIVNKEGKLTGYNTDIFGVSESLRPFRERLRGAAILLLGAGGGARAVAYALAKDYSPRSIRLHNRTSARAETMAAEFRGIFPSAGFEAISGESRLHTLLAESTLIVNTTSVGMTPNSDSLPVPGPTTFSNQQIIFDIVYNPVETALLKRGRTGGAQILNGVEMLVQQGAKAFELWTGKKFPVELGRSVVIEALSRKKIK